MTRSVRNPPLTALGPECGVSESRPPIFEVWPEVELSRSRKYCIMGGGCRRKTYFVIRRPDYGPYAVTRACWFHLKESERAMAIYLIQNSTVAKYPGVKPDFVSWKQLTKLERREILEMLLVAS